MKKERYVFLKRKQFAALDLFEFLGYIERMEDEGLIEKRCYMGNDYSKNKMLVLSSKEPSLIKKFLKAEENIFAGKLRVSKNLKEEDLKQLKRRFEGLEYRVYRR